LLDSERAKIREIARILETIPERNILVAGHTAMAGTREEQQRTSRERARAVANYLVSLRVRTAAEITVQGYGAETVSKVIGSMLIEQCFTMDILDRFDNP
jgi:outer membrane protein OmpA-like peptidoglycan-associated protein